MSEELRGRLDSRLDGFFVIAAGLVPLCAYLITASGYAYWLDSASLSRRLCLSDAHPPGHPLVSVLGQLACYLPIGPHSFESLYLARVMTACSASSYTERSTRPRQGR